jgi:DnaJ-class molecular chaperone
MNDNELPLCPECDGYGGYIDQQGNTDECPPCHGSGVEHEPGSCEDCPPGARVGREQG